MSMPMPITEKYKIRMLGPVEEQTVDEDDEDGEST
jgi:hypothetical protein